MLTTPSSLMSFGSSTNFLPLACVFVSSNFGSPISKSVGSYENRAGLLSGAYDVEISFFRP